MAIHKGVAVAASKTDELISATGAAGEAHKAHGKQAAKRSLLDRFEGLNRK